MDNFSKEELKKLISHHNEVCISIYMPTHRKGKETQQNPIRYKNLLSQAEKLLSELGVNEDIEKMMRFANHIQSDFDFWQHQSDGLAVFITKDVYYYYRLPISFNELVVVSDRFHLKPLIPISNNQNKFYILALSQNDVGLYKANRQAIHRLKLMNTPTSLNEHLKNRDIEKELQYHTTGGDNKNQAAIYHGTGAGDKDKDQDILHFFRVIDKSVSDILSEDTSPLILAGVEYLHPIYKKTNNYNQLYQHGLYGNPEDLSPEELHKQIWPIIEPLFQSSKKKAIEQYKELSGKKSKLVSDDIKEILTAAFEGRVELIFVRIGINNWGKFNPESGLISIHENREPDDEDLTDLAYVYTILTKGSVYTLSRSDSNIMSNIAAIFRY